MSGVKPGGGGHTKLSSLTKKLEANRLLRHFHEIAMGFPQSACSAVENIGCLRSRGRSEVIRGLSFLPQILPSAQTVLMKSDKALAS